MVMISDFYVARDLKVPGSSPGVGFFFCLGSVLGLEFEKQTT